MQVHLAQADLPYTQQQVFDLVSDIESYPRFLPHVVSARIIQRDGNALVVDQQVRIGPLRPSFRTRARLQSPERIEVVCADSPLGGFTDTWSFTARPSGGTHLQCRTVFEFRSAVLRLTLGTVLGEVLNATVRAFEARARALYGGGPGGRPG